MSVWYMLNAVAAHGEVWLEQSSKETVAFSLVATFYRLIAPRKVLLICTHTHTHTHTHRDRFQVSASCRHLRRKCAHHGKRGARVGIERVQG
jgi:hypothetical protein